MSLPDHLTFVDIETSGMSTTYSRIIEVGLVRVDYGKVTNVSVGTLPVFSTNISLFTDTAIADVSLDLRVLVCLYQV
jgi:DNA polymerase III epsilon subunit-like protein